MSRAGPGRRRLRQLDEPTLLARLQAGDEALFRQIVTELTPVLTRLARKYTTTHAAAQDAVQDTWLTVLDKLDSFQGRSSLKTWVCGILVHTAAQRRTGVPHPAVQQRLVPRPQPSRRPGAVPLPPGRRDAGTWSEPPVWRDQIPVPPTDHTRRGGSAP